MKEHLDTLCEMKVQSQLKWRFESLKDKWTPAVLNMRQCCNFGLNHLLSKFILALFQWLCLTVLSVTPAVSCGHAGPAPSNGVKVCVQMRGPGFSSLLVRVRDPDQIHKNQLQFAAVRKRCVKTHCSWLHLTRVSNIILPFLWTKPLHFVKLILLITFTKF